ncbi:hypothetical protein BN1723_019103, partial [Verticillium longisporum]
WSRRCGEAGLHHARGNR